MSLDPVVACDLGVLSQAERARRVTLAGRASARFLAVCETADGYAARLDADSPLARDILEWILLERRCCPFLRMELAFEPAGGPVWLRFGGGPGVKAFLAASGLVGSSSPAPA